MTTDITELALITKIKNQLKNFDTVVLKEGEAFALVEALEKAQRANAAQDDHINQQQDRINRLEKRNSELGKHVRMLEKRLRGVEESLIAATDMVSELESRTVTVKRPEAVSWEEQQYREEVIAALTTAGIKWEAE